MYTIQETIVDDRVATTKFACDLSQCKGACCTLQGSRGAPLRDEELEEIRNAFPAVAKYLSAEHLQAIAAQGLFEGRPGDYTTTCVNDRACVFVTYEDGIAKCSFEKAYFKNEIRWRKPVSCHLFPIRVDKGLRERLRFEFLAECAPALEKGERENVELSDFLREALTRVYGVAWYKEFSAMSQQVRTDLRKPSPSPTTSYD